MIGAICGDIIGSRFEEFNYKNKTDMFKSHTFDLFNEDSKFTDDTVLTCAVADCLINGKPYAETFMEYGKKYPDAGYGNSFRTWLKIGDLQSYSSFGNGSAMRVSPVGWFFNDMETVLQEAERSAIPTHNHPEGIKGAQAVALAVFMARNVTNTKDKIKQAITEKFGYDLSRTLDEIRPTYKFDSGCEFTVPEAIIAFLESNSYESAIRNAISLGGDADTLACIAGAIAEAFYGFGNIPIVCIKNTTQILKDTAPELYSTIFAFKMKYDAEIIM